MNQLDKRSHGREKERGSRKLYLLVNTAAAECCTSVTLDFSAGGSESHSSCGSNQAWRWAGSKLKASLSFKAGVAGDPRLEVDLDMGDAKLRRLELRRVRVWAGVG